MAAEEAAGAAAEHQADLTAARQKANAAGHERRAAAAAGSSAATGGLTSFDEAAAATVWCCRLALSIPHTNRLELCVLKLKCDTLLTTFAFKFNLRRYTTAKATGNTAFAAKEYAKAIARYSQGLTHDPDRQSLAPVLHFSST